MRKITVVVLAIAFTLLGCSNSNPPSAITEDIPSNEQNTQVGCGSMTNVNVQIKNKSFTLVLFDNISTRALIEKFPLTLDMSELNGNEKFYFFPEDLPSFNEKVDEVRTGDLLLYGSDCLVLFYEDYSTPYSYTRLGYIEDVSELTDVLGEGNVEITFHVE